MDLPAVNDWHDRIVAAWRASVQGILDCGRLLVEAKAALPHGAFGAMVEGLPFGARTAQRLMAIAEDQRLSNATHGSHLPANWRTLYELSRLDDETFDARLADGTIRPEMDRRDITTIAKKARREARETDLASRQVALPEKRYGVIYADPEWRFEPWSRESGMDRAPDNHYPTTELADIKARDVASIAAADCVLFLWATAPMIAGALDVVAAWGFGYRSHMIWRKVRKGAARGTGYWFTGEHELLLVGTRGAIPAPAPGTQWPSVIEAPVGRHSAKPDEFAHMIEEYFPTLPRIELNARAPRPGWDVWGNEVGEEARSEATGKKKRGEERSDREGRQ